MGWVAGEAAAAGAAARGAARAGVEARAAAWAAAAEGEERVAEGVAAGLVAAAWAEAGRVVTGRGKGAADEVAGREAGMGVAGRAAWERVAAVVEVRGVEAKVAAWGKAAAAARAAEAGWAQTCTCSTAWCRSSLHHTAPPGLFSRQPAVKDAAPAAALHYHQPRLRYHHPPPTVAQHSRPTVPALLLTAPPHPTEATPAASHTWVRLGRDGEAGALL